MVPQKLHFLGGIFWRNGNPDLDPDMDHFSDPDSASNWCKFNEFKDARMILGDLFPDRFHTKVQYLQFYMVPQGSDSQAFFKTLSNLPFLNSTLKKRFMVGSTGQRGSLRYYLLLEGPTKFPSKTRVNPVHYPFKVPPKNPYVHVEDEDLKQLLEAPAFTTVPLDHSAFDSPSVDLARNPHTHLDTLLRSSLLASYTID